MNSHLILVSLVVLFVRASTRGYTDEGFIQCLSDQSTGGSMSGLIYAPNNSSYTSILEFFIQNPRFDTPDKPKPQLIITPTHETHIQAVICCSKSQGIEIRIRSGGHDYEGLSYRSQHPYIILDLFNFKSIQIDTNSETAWVQSGATIGELYYRIYQKSETLAFPAGVYPTVGVGGHFSGGGYGTMLRKFGLAADHVIDAVLIDVNGNILDRKGMGEDLFWAIRGGGGSNFGVTLAWKVSLVRIPSTVTVFTVLRNSEQNATELVYRWQQVAPTLVDDLFLRLNLTRVASNNPKNPTVASFDSLYLGTSKSLVSLMDTKFPELGLRIGDCMEMKWIDSVLYFAGFPLGTSPEYLLNRTQLVKRIFKAKSDFVKEPIPEKGIEGIWDMLYELQPGEAMLLLNPYGAKMEQISETAIPFPHRKGNLYKIQHVVSWDRRSSAKEHIEWIRRLYAYLAPYVSKSPREAYINYNDLDLGVNGEIAAGVWGPQYFKSNFERLVRVKTEVDPSNFFWNEQSIPTLANLDSEWGLDRERKEADLDHDPAIGRCEDLAFGYLLCNNLSEPNL